MTVWQPAGRGIPLRFLHTENYVLWWAWEPGDVERLWVSFAIYDVLDATSFATAEPVLDGFVKFDGCTQFNSPNIHVDSARQLAEIFSLIAWARGVCVMELLDGCMIDELRAEYK